MISVEHGDADIVRFLVENGADMNVVYEVCDHECVSFFISYR